MVAKGFLLKSINPQGVVLEGWKLVTRCKKTLGIQILSLFVSHRPHLHRPFNIVVSSIVCLGIFFLNCTIHLIMDRFYWNVVLMCKTRAIFPFWKYWIETAAELIRIYWLSNRRHIIMGHRNASHSHSGHKWFLPRQCPWFQVHYWPLMPKNR